MTTLSFSSTPARTARLIIVAFALLLGLILLLTGPAQPAAASCGGVTTVSTEAELNAAIAAYNAVGTSPCVFTIQLSGDIPLAASTTAINNATAGVELVIEGSSHALDTNATGVRMLRIEADTDVTVRHITVANGNVAGSGAGARVAAGGSLTVERSTFSGNSSTDVGGGILSDGSLTITDSAITGNSSQSDGGAIYIGGGSATIEASTISGNAAGGSGGGILMFSDNGQLTITNSTISGNTAPSGRGGGLAAPGGTTTLLNSTVTANQAGGGGGIAQIAPAAVSLGNTIVAGNTAVISNDDLLGTITSNDYNLIGIAPFGFTAQPHDITGQDPVLGLLQNNGGPTETHALLPGSPAINAGDTPLTTDQRGVARPQGPADDIGAFEASCPAFPADVASEAELNFAIGCYNAQTTAGTYTINITQDIDLTASTTAIDNATSGVELLIEGGSHTVDGQGTINMQPLVVNAGTTVTIQNITITGGNMANNAAAGSAPIKVDHGMLTVKASTLSGNKGTFGGAISNVGGTLIVMDSTLSANRAEGFVGLGGAIYNASAPGGSMTVINSTLSGNQAQNSGGAVYNTPDSQLTVINSTISDNQAPPDDGNGNPGTGGITNSTDATATLHNTIVANNLNGDCLNLSGTINAQNSLIEDGLTCVNGVNLNNLTGDPNLGVLQNNGGPTETHALLPGSIAINAGANALAVDPDSNPLTTDQRGTGYSRIIDGTVDMGAYEASASTAVTLRDLQARRVTLLQRLLGLLQR